MWIMFKAIMAQLIAQQYQLKILQILIQNLLRKVSKTFVWSRVHSKNTSIWLIYNVFGIFDNFLAFLGRKLGILD